MHPVLKFFLAGLFSFAPLVHAAPPVAWATHLAGSGFQHAGTTTLSPAGNVYFTGHAGLGAAFRTNNSTAAQASGWFLAKHDPAGRLLWLQPSSRIFSDSLSTAFDSAENLYMTGVFSERAELGNFVLSGVSNRTHVFVVKFEPDGSVPWAFALPETDSENRPRLALGPSGDIYLARTEFDRDEDDPFIYVQRYGPAGNPIWFQPALIFKQEGVNLRDLKVDATGNAYVLGNLESAATDTAEYFLTKFDPAGSRLWTLVAPGTDEDDHEIEMAISSDGFLYVAGDFSTQTRWGTNVLSVPAGDGVFLTKITFAGDVLWARSFAGTFTDFDQDPAGNCHLAGDFSGTLALGTNSLTSRGSSDFFLTKFDRDGTLLWVRQAGGTGWDHSPAVSVDHSGNAFMSGFFVGPVDFGRGVLMSQGLTDLFIVKYNRHGTPLWGQRFGGSDYEYPGTSNELPDSDWVVDAAGNIYFAATFWGTTHVGVNTFPSFGETDVFLAKLSADPAETLRLLRPAIHQVTSTPVVQLSVVGTQGRAPIHIEASSDLRLWTAIHTQAVPSEPITISQPLSAPVQFYRALIP